MHAPEYGDVNFLVDCLPLQEKFVMNNTPGVKKNHYHRLCCEWLPPHFLWWWSTHWPPFGALPLGLRVVLETPLFIHSNETVDERGIILRLV